MRMWMTASAWLVVFCASDCATLGQVIYEPVTYQYGSRVKYYYGGSDPAVIARADAFDQTRSPYTVDARYPDPFGEPAQPPLRVYHDRYPHQNAAVYGYTAMDAMNRAYAGVPCYFRKSDLLRLATPKRDGSWVVSAQAARIEYKLVNAPPAPAARGSVLIIPRTLLPRPVNRASDQWLAIVN